MRADVSRLVAACALLACSPTSARAQLRVGSVELFGTVGGLAGVTAVSTTRGNTGVVHGGLRLDAGIQGDRLALATALRAWEIAPSDVGGKGVDLLLIGEFRLGQSTRTVARGGVGAGLGEIETDRAANGPTVQTDGVVWTAGVAHEWVAPSSALVIFSLDVLLPQLRSEIGRRRPVVEVGVGYRFRSLRAIGPLITRGR